MLVDLSVNADRNLCYYNRQKLFNVCCFNNPAKAGTDEGS